MDGYDSGEAGPCFGAFIKRSRNAMCFSKRGSFVNNGEEAKQDRLVSRRIRVHSKYYGR
jgi:hypothetical protein